MNSAFARSLLSRRFSSFAPPALSLETVLDTIQANVAHTVNVPSEVRCAHSHATGVYVGLADGSVGVLRSGREFAVVGKHQGSVTAVDSCGGVFVSASSDETVAVWTEGGDYGLPLRVAMNVNCVKVLASGLCAISGLNDHAIKVVQVSSLETAATLKGHSLVVRCFAATADSEFLLSGSDDKTVRVWRLRDFSEHSVLRGHSGSVKCIALFDSEHRVASSGSDAAVKVWTLRDGLLLYTLEGHSAAVLCLLAAVDGKTVVTGSEDRTVRCWDAVNGTEAAVLVGHKAEVRVVVQTCTGEFVLSASDDRTIKMWALADYCEVATFAGHSSDVSCIALTADENALVSGSFDCTVKVWSICELKQDTVLQGHEDQILCMVATTDGKLLTGSKDCRIGLWALGTMSLQGMLLGHTESVLCVAVTLDSRCAVSGSADHTVRMWSLQDQAEVAVMSVHSSAVTSILVSATGRYSVSAGEKTVVVWDLQQRAVAVALSGHEETITALVEVPSDKFAASGAGDGVVKLWALHNHEEAATLSAHTDAITSLAATADGKRLLSASMDTVIRVWSVPAMRPLYQLLGHSGWVTTIEVARSGEYVVSAAADRLVKVWELRSGKVVATLFGHLDTVDNLALLPDSTHLVTSAYDKSIKLWNLDDMQEVTTLRGHTFQRIAVAASGGRSVILVSEEESIRCIDLSFPLSISATQPPKLPNPLSDYRPGTNSAFGSCISLLESGGFVDSKAAKLTVRPYLLNALHVCCFYDNWEALERYLRAEVAVIRGCFGSPVTVAIWRNTEKCLDVILDHLSALCDRGTEWSAVKAVTDDLPQLLQTGTSALTPFITSLFQSSSQPDIPNFLSPRAPLPITAFLPHRYIQSDTFQSVAEATEEVVEFRTSSFRWNFHIGSSRSLELLEALERCRDSRVLRTPLVSALLDSKWTALRPLVLGRTAVYAAMLGCLALLTFSIDPSLLLRSSFSLLNVLLLLYEVLLMKGRGSAYWHNFWNYVDLLRAAVSLLWVCTLSSQSLHFLAATLCFLRGFTYFSAFHMTRIFVRLVIEVVQEMYSFLTIMAYSTCAFGVMFAVLSSDKRPFTAWRTAYELLMGNFSTEEFGTMQWVCFTAASLVNVIILLNLLISILGDAYDKAQMYSWENDCLEKISLIIEHESLFFLRRSSGKASILCVCSAQRKASATDIWEGRIHRILSGVQVYVQAEVEKHREETRAMEDRLNGKLAEIGLLLAKLTPAQ